MDLTNVVAVYFQDAQMQIFAANELYGVYIDPVQVPARRHHLLMMVLVNVRVQRLPVHETVPRVVYAVVHDKEYGQG